ncbi:phosphoribosyltransferase family protein [Cryobacterium sp. PH31-O1]|uniref:phosphoribosyltransferase n=1 Tax=Cryobacterium sp. PH31-O1 TaxID=3046306 RepID=UPI0024BB2A11|nr:phosphoribosyltransferase family protein [Cryobacterium sp. PH31-O1]MDJ0339008.1 phosphoribosyltransferase family protein [Cryobacterium sp. PH31-O1]
MFANRADAGRQLAARLEYLRPSDPVVVGLPRGGVPVAFEVARALHAPLDVIVVRKLGVPIAPEVAMGAIGEDGVRVLNDDVLRQVGVSAGELSAVEERERAQLEAGETLLRGGRSRVELTGRVVIIVDDGIATGATARVACLVARRLGAGRVVVAVPVAPAGAALRLGADELVCVLEPPQFWAVGAHYRDFRATTDAEVVALLAAGMVS